MLAFSASTSPLVVKQSITVSASEITMHRDTLALNDKRNQPRSHFLERTGFFEHFALCGLVLHCRSLLGSMTRAGSGSRHTYRPQVIGLSLLRTLRAPANNVRSVLITPFWVLLMSEMFPREPESESLGLGGLCIRHSLAMQLRC